MSLRCVLCVLLIAKSMPGGESDLFTAVRDGDAAAVERLLNSAVDANARDQFGATPLMYAAAYGSSNDLRLLLKRGANVNAVTKEGSTALMWATADAEKVRLLLDAGAELNARSSNGATALLSAAIRQNSEVFRMLIARGADTSAEMQLLPSIPIRVNVDRLAYATNEPTLRNLLKEAKRPAPTLQSLIANPGSDPMSGLFMLTSFSLRRHTKPGLAEGLAAVLQLGADPNASIRQLTRTLPILALTASYGDVEGVRTVLQAGADPNRAGTQGLTPLMIAASAENPSAPLIESLLERGADVKALDASGRTALDWALLQGESPVSRLLRARGATRGDWKPGSTPAPEAAGLRTPTQAVELALARLHQSGPKFNAGANCISCHHQSLPAVASAIARSRGVPVPVAATNHPTEATLRMWAPSRENFLMGNCSVFGFLGNVGYGFFGFAEERVVPNAITDAAASCLSSLQWPDGRWEGGDMRPPLAGRSPLVYTALAIRALKTYSPPARRKEVERQIALGRKFLLFAETADSQGEAFRLMGLVWSGAERRAIDRQQKRVLRLQHASGGWAQRGSMRPDAYATGQAMYALAQSGLAKTAKPFREAVSYLMRTQLEDGTWFLSSRTMGFQPYFETGFPHGKNQFISAAATAWAAIGIALTL